MLMVATALGLVGIVAWGVTHRGSSAAPMPAPDLSLRVTGRLVLGGRMVVSGSGFPAGSRLVATINADPVPGAEVRAAGATGAYRIAFRIPADERPGLNYLTVETRPTMNPTAAIEDNVTISRP